LKSGGSTFQFKDNVPRRLLRSRSPGPKMAGVQPLPFTTTNAKRGSGLIESSAGELRTGPFGNKGMSP